MSLFMNDTTVHLLETLTHYFVTTKNILNPFLYACLSSGSIHWQSLGSEDLEVSTSMTRKTDHHIRDSSN